MVVFLLMGLEEVAVVFVLGVTFWIAEVLMRVLVLVASSIAEASRGLEDAVKGGAVPAFAASFFMATGTRGGLVGGFGLDVLLLLLEGPLLPAGALHTNPNDSN